MGDYRIRYGWALGPEGTYAVRSDKTVLPESGTTPDVTDNTLVYTQNTTNTVISYWNVRGAGGQAGDGFHQGKRLVVFFKDGSTSVVAGAQMVLLNTGGATSPAGGYPAGTIAEYVLHNSAWYELTRAEPTAATPFVTPAVSVVAGSFSVNVTTANVLILSASGGGAQLVSLSGGQVGQIVTLFNNSTNTITIAADGVGNIRAATSAFILAGSGAIQLLNYGPAWVFIRGAVAN